VCDSQSCNISQACCATTILFPFSSSHLVSVFSSSPLPLLTLALAYPCPCSPLPLLTLALAHPCPCSPLPLLTLTLAHPCPCSPLPLLTLALAHPCPCSPLPLLTLALAHPCPCSPSPLLTLALAHPRPCPFPPSLLVIAIVFCHRRRLLTSMRQHLTPTHQHLCFSWFPPAHSQALENVASLPLPLSQSPGAHP